jgi:hypothetical protein
VYQASGVRKVEKERSIDQCSKTLSLVMMVQGLPKTEASAKDVPLDVIWLASDK